MIQTTPKTASDLPKLTPKPTEVTSDTKTQLLLCVFLFPNMIYQWLSLASASPICPEELPEGTPRPQKGPPKTSKKATQDPQ